MPRQQAPHRRYPGGLWPSLFPCCVLSRAVTLSQVLHPLFLSCSPAVEPQRAQRWTPPPQTLLHTATAALVARPARPVVFSLWPWCSLPLQPQHYAELPSCLASRTLFTEYNKLASFVLLLEAQKDLVWFSGKLTVVRFLAG